MDLAKNLAHWRDQPPEQWITQVNRYLPPIAVVILVLLLAFKGADLTWRLLESPSVQDTVPPAVRVAAAADRPRAGSYESLEGWEPFGKAPDESAAGIPVDVLLDAPETSLNFTLVGTVQAQKLPERGSIVLIQDKARAIIAVGRGEQQAYDTGQKIDGLGNVTLHSVFTDQIYVMNNGRLETKRFEDQADTPLASSRLTPRQQTAARQVESLSAAASLADAATGAAALIGEHIQIAMATEGGQLIGFRVNPRGDGRVFNELGLEAGDILTEVNGIRLNDMRNAAQVLDALGEAQQASVTVRRNDSDQALILDIGQIQRLAESLQ